MKLLPLAIAIGACVAVLLMVAVVPGHAAPTAGIAVDR